METNAENEYSYVGEQNGSSTRSPQLSIIVPVYNAEKYLAQCMDSILNQQYANFEVLCVDDGSTDRSGQILDEYARLDSRVKVFHTENRGVSHARNYALERTKGIYVGFVDSDDWIDSDHFSVLLKYFDDSSVDWVWCKPMFEKTDVCCDDCPSSIVCNDDAKELTRDNAFEAIFSDDDVLGYPPCKVFRKEKICNCFNEELTLAEDTLFCCQYAYEIKKVLYVDRRTYHYRCSGTSGAFLLKNLSRISGLKALILVVEFLSQDVQLVKYRDKVINSLLNWYFVLIAYYGQERNVKALSMLSEYKPEIQKYLFLYWLSRHYNLVTKLKASFKVWFPRYWKLLRRLFNKEEM